MKPNNPLQTIFKKFISGKADSHETSLFWAWLWRLDIENKDAATASDEARSRIWEKIEKRTLLQKKAAIVPVWKKLAVAASVIILIAAGISGWQLLHRKQGTALATHSALSTDGNAIRHITLPDGTSVILNIYSSLSFDQGYNEKARRITLKGEAYFKVKKDDERPFIVVSEGLETRALGTAFNIEARETEKQVRIALTEGRVAVQHMTGNQQQHLLSPGQILYWNRTAQEAVTAHFSTNITAWTQGGLVFNSLPLPEALDRISQRFHIPIQYNKEKLSGKTVTASFSKADWKDILTNILYPYALKHQVKDSVIIIH